MVVVVWCVVRAARFILGMGGQARHSGQCIVVLRQSQAGRSWCQHGSPIRTLLLADMSLSESKQGKTGLFIACISIVVGDRRRCVDPAVNVLARLSQCAAQNVSELTQRLGDRRELLGVCVCLSL